MPVSTAAGVRDGALRLVPFALLMLACESGSVAPTPITDPSKLYAQLTLDQHAITLSTTPPYDTITVVATPRNALGQLLTGLPTPFYQSTAVQQVWVSPDGVLHGIAGAYQVMVTATLTLDNHTLADTMLVDVVDGPPPQFLASFTAHTVPPESTNVAVGSVVNLAVQALDSTGTPLDFPTVYFGTSDPSRATIDRTFGDITGVRPGPVTFYTTMTYFGVRAADSVTYNVSPPLSGTVQILADSTQGTPVNRFFPSEIKIAVGGQIAWSNTTGVLTDVTFDDPSTLLSSPFFCTVFQICDTGNVDPFGPPASDPVFFHHFRFRIFPVAGTYEYHSTIHGTTGRVIVSNQ
jgi:plastocyanin